MNDLNKLGNNSVLNRRRWLRRSIGGGAGLTLLSSNLCAAEPATVDATTEAPGQDFKISKGRARQSVMAWCFQPMRPEQLIPACAEMGLLAMEGIDEKYYPLMKQHGLGVSLCKSHPFARGPVSRENHAFCAEQLRAGIDLAVEWNSPGVIAFTGMRERGVSDEQAKQNCIDCWKSVCGYAEEKGINIVLEMLNTRDDSHPMKGHPGYFGNDIDLCIDMIQAVDSPRMKLLFDVYHVQIMNGDVIRRFREHKQFISHVHTAGNPGRCELDESQELYYPAIIRAILDTGYDGYIAHEFIPTWPDKLAALRHGARMCDQ